MKEKKVPCEIFTRTCGYFRPKAQMNPGKQAEVNDRRDLLTGEYITKRNEES
jgi:anaerobic ribonucleoside-triphosphate reductase